eukprot:PhF_6_TR5982/c0_g1_i1/m.8632
MYNGVGVSSARGTATNGYVTRSALVRHVDARLKSTYKDDAMDEKLDDNGAIEDAALAEHDRQRKLLIALAEYEEQLRSTQQPKSEEEIQVLLAKFRQTHSQVSPSAEKSAQEPISENHIAKNKSAESFAQAFGVELSAHKEGNNLDHIVQMRQKEEHQGKRMDRLWQNTQLISKWKEEIYQEELAAARERFEARKRAMKR